MKTAVDDSRNDASRTLTKIKGIGKNAIQTLLNSSRSPTEQMPPKATFKSYIKPEEEDDGEEMPPYHQSRRTPLGYEPPVPAVPLGTRPRSKMGGANEGGRMGGVNEGGKADGRMRRSGSEESVSSHSTVKPLAQGPVELTDYLPRNNHTTLTMSGVQAFTKSEAGKQKGYVQSWDKDPGGRSSREGREGVCVLGRCACGVLRVCVCVNVGEVC